MLWNFDIVPCYGVTDIANGINISNFKAWILINYKFMVVLLLEIVWAIWGLDDSGSLYFGIRTEKTRAWIVSPSLLK